MANLKISQLPVKTSLGSTDLIPIVDESVSPIVTKQITVSNFEASLLGPYVKKAGDTMTGTLVMTPANRALNITGVSTGSVDVVNITDSGTGAGLKVVSTGTGSQNNAGVFRCQGLAVNTALHVQRTLADASLPVANQSILKVFKDNSNVNDIGNMIGINNNNTNAQTNCLYIEQHGTGPIVRTNDGTNVIFDIDYTGNYLAARSGTGIGAGRSLTIQAAGAELGQSNLAGGTLILRSGISTGSGLSAIQFVIYKTIANGTNDNATTTLQLVQSSTGTIGMSVLSIASGSGNAFKFQAQQSSADTDANGGALILAGGDARGAGTSIVQINTVTPSTSGTTVNTSTTKVTIDGYGRVGIGQNPVTAYIHLPAGLATANFSPLKFTSGTNLSSIEDGAMEYDGSHIYMSIGATRYQLDQQVTSSTAVTSITGTTNRLTASASTGAVMLDISASYVGQSSITTLGTITGGTWTGTTIAVANGGTGQTTYTDGQLLIGNSSGNTLAKAALTGTANQITVTNGNGSITLATPQNIHTGASPTFAGLSLGTGALNTVGNISLDGTAARNITVAQSATTTGAALTVQSGQSVTGGTNETGGQLLLKANAGTGNNASGIISFFTPTDVGSGTTTQVLSEKMRLNTAGNGRLIIGNPVSIPTSVDGITLRGDVARNLIVSRSTGNTAGFNLTIQSGGASGGGAATDKNAGNLILASGIATGTGSGIIQFQTSKAQASTNTTDNAVATVMTLDGNGRLFIGSTTSPSSTLHLVAGSATANTAPLQLNSGTLETTARAGVVEYNGNFYATQGGAVRYSVGGTLFDHFADGASTSTNGTFDDLYTDTTAANTFNTNGDKLTARYSGIIVASATATRDIKVLFAGTTILDTGALTTATADGFDVSVMIIRESSTVVRCIATIIVSTTTGTGVFTDTTYTRITGLTLSGTNILKITGAAAATGAASGDITAKLGTIQFQPAV